MAGKRDYYEVLGVARTSTEVEITKAYRKLAMQHHPDRNVGDADAEVRFKEVTEAYEVLRDPHKRERYDRHGHAGLGGGGGFPGGGVALLRCVPVVEQLSEKLKGDERVGAEIVVRALAKPIRTIAENCGKDGAVIADEVRTRGEKNPNVGYNANTDEYVDMFKAGIVDPTRVTRNALQNAASIAGLMLTTEVMVTKIDEDDKKSRVTGAVA